MEVYLTAVNLVVSQSTGGTHLSPSECASIRVQTKLQYIAKLHSNLGIKFNNRVYRAMKDVSLGDASDQSVTLVRFRASSATCWT